MSRFTTRSRVALLAIAFASVALAQEGKIVFQPLSLPASLGLPDRHANFVLRSLQDWNAWLDKLSVVADPLPTVDFERYTLLVASAGYRAHGPVVVTFDSIIDMGNVVQVHVSVTSPPACPQVPEAGHYAAMALIPRTDKPVEFDVSSTDRECPAP